MSKKEGETYKNGDLNNKTRERETREVLKKEKLKYNLSKGASTNWRTRAYNFIGGKMCKDANLKKWVVV